MTSFVGRIATAPKSNVVNIGGVQTPVTNFSVAENYVDSNGTKHTQFYKISMWRNKTRIAQYLEVGRPVFIEGRVSLDKPYIDKDGKPAAALKLSNPRITLIGSKPVTAAPAETPEEVPAEEPDELEEMPWEEDEFPG